MSKRREALSLLLTTLFVPMALAIEEPVIYTVAGGGPNEVPSMGYVRLYPNGVAVESNGDVYLSHGSHVYRVDHATSLLTIYAGGGGEGDGNPASSANLGWPRSLALDAAGNLLIADNGSSSVRRVDRTTGLISTVAAIETPWGIALDAAGNILVSSSSLYAPGGHRVQRIDAGTGIVTTVAGTGTPGFAGDGGPAHNALLRSPKGLTIDSAGNLFIADAGNRRIRRVDAATGTITTFAGTGAYGIGGDGGPATSAAFRDPTGLAVDAAGNVFVSDFDRNDGDGSWSGRVRRVDAVTGIISRFAGGGSNPNDAGDGGPATDALFFYPEDIAIDAAGNLFTADTGRLWTGSEAGIRRVRAADGVIMTVAGGDDESLAEFPLPATNAALGRLADVAYDAAGNLYFVDSQDYTLHRVDAATGIMSIIVSAYSAFDRPHGVAVRSSGTVFVADTWNHRVAAVTPQGSVGTFLGSSHLQWPYDVEVEASQDVLIADTYHHRVLRVPPSGPPVVIAGTGVAGFGGDGGPATQALLSFPIGIGVGPDGDVYIAEEGNVRIRRIDAATGVITTVAGTGTGGFGGDGGPATAALLAHPTDVEVEPDGSLLILDEGNNRIRRVDAGTGIITTVMGTGVESFSGDGGPASQASVWWDIRRVGLARDPTGGFAFADARNGRIRKVASALPSPGSVPDGDIVSGTPLGVTHAPGGDITLTWSESCIPTDRDYAIYEGTLGNYASHASRFCSTGGARGFTFTPAAHDAYYLVVPSAGGFEGSYGLGSDGSQRPQATGACFPQTIGSCGTCGDGTIALPETCDASGPPPPLTCTSLGYNGGSLACAPGCVLDVSGCTGSSP